MNTRKPGNRKAKRRASETAGRLERARACFERQEWEDAFAAFSDVDQSQPLAADDLHRLAWSAGLTGRDDEMLETHERVYHARLEAGEGLAAARAAFWLGFRLLSLGEAGRAGGWLSRSQRLVELHGRECVEQGWLLLPVGHRHLLAGEPAEAHDAAARAAGVGERFNDADLVAFARNLQARALLAQGHVARGLALMDEAMLPAVSGELSPVVTGIIYCSAIANCNRVYALDRAREWTAALAAWCDAHPQVGMFTGHCLVHRAEILEMSGSWVRAVEEARRAVARCVRDIERDAAGNAHCLQADIHRLLGEFALAEEAYRAASRSGVEPQPGLALLRLAQGDRDAAASAIRRIVTATKDRLRRTRFLPAYVEIMLAVGDLDEARSASLELAETAANFGSEVLLAIAAHARGTVQLAEGDAHGVLEPVRRAFATWQRIGAEYHGARLRMLLARACMALGDAEGSHLELEYAREVFARLGARPDLAAAQAVVAGAGRGEMHGADTSRHKLTERELQVLRLIASGKTNKAIARELALSGKTVDRHVSNIFSKVDVSSRAAATAYAYRHKLI